MSSTRLRNTTLFTLNRRHDPQTLPLYRHARFVFWIERDLGGSFLPFFLPGWTVPNRRKKNLASLCGEADPAALHADFQAIRGLAAGVHDAAVHVAGAAAVVAQFVGAAAAAAAGLGRAGAARGLRHHHVAKRQELAKQAGQDAVDAAVWVRTSEAVRVEHLSRTM